MPELAWRERERSALWRKDSRPTEQPNFLFVSGSQTSWLSDAGSLFHMSFMKCISISAIFGVFFFFSDTVLLVLLWVLTKKRLMNIKDTNFTANRLQYTCYIQFLLAYLHTFFSSDLEQCPGLNNKKLFLLSGYTYYFQLMQVDRSEPK